MIETSVAPGSASPVVLEYQLTEADVHRFVASHPVDDCRRICRRQGWGMLVLIALGMIFCGLFYRSHGMRSVGVAILGATGVLGCLAWLRRTRSCRRACRLARAVGVPLDLHLTASPEGITKDPTPDDSDPGRTFAWSEVVEIDRVDHLTVIHLRPAGGVLLIPDRAFTSREDRERFVAAVGDWKRTASSP